MREDERLSEERLRERERLLQHVDYFFRPPPRFYDDLEHGSAEPCDASIVHHDAQDYGDC